MKEFLEISEENSLESLLHNSEEAHEVLLFKFSPYCTISFVADNVLAKWFKNISEEKALKIAKINVITSRSLSNSIAETYNIKHESPQIIWLDEKGNVKWHGSHHRITEAQMEKLMKKEVDDLSR